MMRGSKAKALWKSQQLKGRVLEDYNDYFDLTTLNHRVQSLDQVQ